jgi:Flp pilus assembly protein TadB
VVTGLLSAGPLLAVLLGAIGGGCLMLAIVALRGLPPRPPGGSSDRLARQLRGLLGVRGAVAVIAGVLVLAITGWVVGGIGVALLVLGWRSLSGAAGERRAMARLEGLATWTESLRDTIAGAVGLEQAIPASLRVAAPSLQEPLGQLVARLHTRLPMPEALRRFADDLDDPSADLIIAALIINSRLRGPGLRDLLGALSASVREELDMRRKVNAERRSTRRSAQIVVGISVALALGLALFNQGYVHSYDSPLGQLVLVVVVALYAAGFIWMRKLATFKAAERLLGTSPVTPSAAPSVAPSVAPPAAFGTESAETVTAGSGGRP